METGHFASDISQLAPQDVVDTTSQTADAGQGATTTDGTTTETTAAPNTDVDNTVDDSAEVTVIDQLKALYQVEDELPNEVEGIQKLVDTVGTKKAEALVKEKFDKYPVMGELEAHLNAGKSIESFFNVKQVETSKLPIYKLSGDEKKDAETKAYFKDVIKANGAEIGLSESQIRRMTEAAELEGKLEEDYQEAVKGWNARRDAEAQTITQQEEQTRLAEQAKEAETVDKINKLIDSGTIGEAIIPVAERAEFKKFQMVQDDKGLTARDRLLQTLPIEKFLLIDYLLFKDFKIKGLQMAPNKVQQLASLNNGRKGTLTGGADGNAATDQRLPEGIASMDFSRLASQ